eukprot:1114721-Prorocentrum_minimum.AAC.1
MLKWVDRIDERLGEATLWGVHPCYVHPCCYWHRRTRKNEAPKSLIEDDFWTTASPPQGRLFASSPAPTR